MALSDEEVAAYMAGRKIGRANGDPCENPHPKGLFIDNNLWEAWAQGWKDGRDYRVHNVRKRRHAFNRA